MYPARSSLLDKMSTFVTLSECERSALATLPKNRRVHAEGANIVFEGQPVRAAHIVECGWVSAYKILCDGSRQVLNFLIPGDCLGLYDQFLRRSDQTFQAVTPVVIVGTVSNVDLPWWSGRSLGWPGRRDHLQRRRRSNAADHRSFGLSA